MQPRVDGVLAINGGSSSLKFALFENHESLLRRLAGKFDRVGLPNTSLSVKDLKRGEQHERRISCRNHAECVPVLKELLKSFDSISVDVISHRIVHGGMHFWNPQLIDGKVVEELQELSPFAPEHLPMEIELIEEFARCYPEASQFACFDTAFHHDMPLVSQMLPIPRRYFEQGVRRYGFHGLSYGYLMEELEKIDRVAAQGRVIMAHLGNGASMTAVKGGKSIDTTMGFTPAAGLVMSTRTGDLDPGLVDYFARTEGMNPEQFDRMINKQSGLLGVSELTSDVRDLLARESKEERAAQAIAVFCQQAKKWIGALSAELGGLNTLIFSGGIGENSSVIRKRICEGLEFLGIELEQVTNESNAPVISKRVAKVTVRVIPTDEELCLAELAVAEIGKGAARFAAKSEMKKETTV